MFDSDFNIRLATLAALGGDTSVTFDSVYSIDLEILKLTSGGGGGGMDYNAIKAALAASGVTEILFNDGDSSVTLDYAKVMQIGKGNYTIVNSVDELSGITNLQDGMVAYLKEHDTTEERMVLRMDFYGGWNYLRIAYNDGNTLTLELWDNGHATSFGGNAKYYKYGSGDSDTMNDHQSDLPQEFMYNANGAIGTYVSMEEGDEYSTNGDYKNTFYFKKYDGAYPTITWEPAGDCTTVSSSLTTENITVHYGEKGWYKYYANVSGGTWLPYEIMWDSLDPTDRIDIINQFATYKMPLKVYRNVNSYGNSLREFEAVARSTDWEHPELVDGINFFATVSREPSAEIRLPQFGYNWDGEQQKWNTDNAYVSYENLERAGTGYRNIREYAVQIANANSEYFAAPNTIYNIPISGVVSGTVYSTEIVADLTDHNWDENCFKFNNGWNGFDCWFSIRKDGYIRTECGSRLVIPAEGINPNGNEWTICNYAWQDEANSGNGAYAVAAVRMIETTANTYLVEMFVSKSQDGYQDQYSTEFNQEKSYTWTEASGQTMDVQPTIYSYGIIAKQSRVFFDKPMKTVVMTQQEYEALSVKDNNTIYYTTSN